MPLNFLRFSFPGVPNARCAFQIPGTAPTGSSRNISLDLAPGSKATIRNRRQLASLLAADGLKDVAELRQVHGTVMRFEPEAVPADSQPAVEGDGLACARTGLGLMIKTADCQPILIAHRSGHCIAALHVGWRGNRAHFPQSGVASFCQHYGLAPRELMAVRGPSLGPQRAEFINFNREWGREFLPWYDAETQTVDLWEVTRQQLRDAGLPASQIFGLDICTYSNADFFSYRRDRNCGRQASIIWLASGESQK